MVTCRFIVAPPVQIIKAALILGPLFSEFQVMPIPPYKDGTTIYLRELTMERVNSLILTRGDQNTEVLIKHHDFTYRGNGKDKPTPGSIYDLNTGRPTSWLKGQRWRVSPGMLCDHAFIIELQPPGPLKLDCLYYIGDMDVTLGAKTKYWPRRDEDDQEAEGDIQGVEQ